MYNLLIFSAGRSDFSLLLPIINILKKYKKVKIIISSQHLDKRFGNTINEIKEKKIKIHYKNKEKLRDTKLINIFTYFSRSSLEYFSFLQKEKPKAVFVLGDRYEVFSFTIAAYFLNIRIIHMHGGELTFGSFDDGIRHSISKLANLHFVINENYKKRLINMGEDPKTIFNYGSTACEQIKLTKFEDKNFLYKKFKLKFDKTILITFHPETRSSINAKEQINIVLKALSCFKKYNLVFTSSNSDTYGNYFNKQIIKFKKKYQNIYLIENMGQKIYWNFIKRSLVVVGNSSSGIIEAPQIGTPTLNIGNRQEGRIYSKSIFHSTVKKKDIIIKLKKILKKKKFDFDKNFYKKQASKNISSEILKFLKKKRSNKKFHDIKRLY
jgi:GDP/UDP-N,N'-diacetylbacillosamine 2-epimerase (hydrolysing)